MDTKKLRQKILDLAIRGKLVPQDPNDEPASVLLERIRAEKERLIKEGKIKRSKKSTSDTPHYENVPFEVPEGWVWCRLSEIANYGGGKTPSMDNKQYWSNGTNLWITSKDMKCERITDSMMKISNDALDIMTQYEPGTLLMVTRSGILRHSLPIAILEEKATVNQDLKTISLHLKETHEYVYYAIKARERYILKEYHKDGTTVDSINFEKFAEILLPIPPYDEQKRIVIAIKQWLSFIDQLEQDANDLETSIQQTKTKILELAIHGKLVPQDPNDEPAIKLLKRINPKFTPCDNAHYENNTIKTPENWEWVKLSDIAVTELGKTLDKGKNSGTPHNYLCAFNVKWCSFDLSVIKKILLEDEELERYRVRKGDLLICEGGDVGRAAIWESDQDIYYQNALHRVRFKDEINQHFYLYVLQYYKSLGMIDDVSSGVTIKHFTQNSMKKLSFPLPPIKEQYRIVSAINQYNTLLDNISANL